MRRGVASVLFLVAAACLAVAAGGWWLQRVAFDPDRSGDLAAAVLEDADIRNQVATVTADATASTLGIDPPEVRRRVDELAQTSAGAQLMGRIVADAHGTLIGARPGPVQLTGADLVELTRDQRVADLPPVTLPVQEVTALSVMRQGLDWVVPAAAIAGALALLIGLVAHPRKADAVFGIGMFCIFAALAVVLVGYAVPVYLVPALTKATWAAIVPAVARDALPIVIGAAVVLCAGGLALMAAAAAARRRRAWSSPVPVHRYADQHRWS